MKEHRIRLYHSVQAALQDDGKEGWHYEQVLSHLRALLDVEAAESGEDASNPAADKLGEIEDLTEAAVMTTVLHPTSMKTQRLLVLST